MAGGKISPRQKMINMMYLVLTALLALNVSKEVLMAFQTMADSLDMTARQLSDKNQLLAQGLREILEEQQKKGKKENLYLLPIIQDIRKEADEKYGEIEKHLSALKSDTIAGWDSVKQTLNKADDLDNNYRYWMKQSGADTDNEGRGAGQAMVLKDMLDNYVEWANQRMIKTVKNNPEKHEKGQDIKKMLEQQGRLFKPLVLNPAENKMVPDDSEMKDKTWEYITFHSTPAIANVALLQKFKTDIRVIEGGLLEFVKGRMTDKPIFTIRKLQLVLAPENTSVLAGQKFRANVIITMGADKQAGAKKPTFSGNAKANPKDPMTGIVEMTANPRLLKGKKSRAKQSYSVVAKIPKTSGDFETLKETGSFEVVKPVVEIGSFKINPLYFQCYNELEASCPALGNDFKPDFSTGQGKIKTIPGKVKTFAVIPTRPKKIRGEPTLVLKIGNKAPVKISEITSKSFKVIKPPKPEILAFIGKKPLDPSQDVPMNATLRLCVQSEKNFYEALPKDARYKMKGFEVKKKVGIGSYANAGYPSRASKPSGRSCVQIQVSRIGGLIKNKSSISFSPTEVVRVNYEGKEIPVSISIAEATKTAPIG